MLKHHRQTQQRKKEEAVGLITITPNIAILLQNKEFQAMLGKKLSSLLWCCEATVSIMWWTQWKPWRKWWNICCLWWTRKEERHVEWESKYLWCITYQNPQHAEKEPSQFYSGKTQKKLWNIKKAAADVLQVHSPPSFEVVPNRKSKAKQVILITSCSWWRRSCPSVKNREKIQLMNVAPASWLRKKVAEYVYVSQ